MYKSSEYYKEKACRGCGTLINVWPITKEEYDRLKGKKSDAFHTEAIEVYEDLFGVDILKLKGVVLIEQDSCECGTEYF
tara:strand:- start:131668 stop:131904 length:237 start_codon:yes stop_codon:yes gene_type:complete